MPDAGRTVTPSQNTTYKRQEKGKDEKCMLSGASYKSLDECIAHILSFGFSRVFWSRDQEHW